MTTRAIKTKPDLFERVAAIRQIYRLPQIRYALHSQFTPDLKASKITPAKIGQTMSSQLQSIEKQGFASELSWSLVFG